MEGKTVLDVVTTVLQLIGMVRVVPVLMSSIYLLLSIAFTHSICIE